MSRPAIVQLAEELASRVGCDAAQPFDQSQNSKGVVTALMVLRGVKPDKCVGRNSQAASCSMEGQLIEIILTVCAIAHPDNCEEKYLQFAFAGSPEQCMMAAQPYIAQWIGEHPAWVTRKWSCGYPGAKKQRI